MLSRFRFLILSQLTMTCFLYAQVFNPQNDGEDNTFHQPPPGLTVVLSRWICALFLHISQSDEVEVSFKIMKYSINHPWKFTHWWGAFNVGLFQFCVLVMVEFVSLMVLLLQDSVLDVLMNFLALTIITEFDDYLFQTLYKDPISDLIKEGEATFGGKKRELSDII